MSSLERLNAKEIQELIDGQGYVLLDVRSVPEYIEEHAQGAYNVPFLHKTHQGMVANPEFSQIVQGLLPDKSAGVVTTCQMGGRSVRAAQELLNLGYSRVVDLRGGFAGEKDAAGNISFEGWKGNGLPTETGDESDRSYRAISARVLPPEPTPEASTDPGDSPPIPSGERWAHPDRRVMCAKLKQDLPAMRRKPMGGPMGIKLKKQISAPAWEMWVEHSKMIINEYKLNPADAKSQEMLLKQCEEFCFGDGGERPPEFVAEGSTPNPE